MLSTKKRELDAGMNVKRKKPLANIQDEGISEEFCESFHEASMAAVQEIKKGKKPKFVQVA